MLKNLVKLSEEKEFDYFLQNNHDKLVLVKFSAEWCGPCKNLQENIKKILGELKHSNQLSKDLVILEVDADRFPQLEYRDQAQKIQQLTVYSLPTLFLFQRNKVLKKAMGSMNVQQLREFMGI